MTAFFCIMAFLSLVGASEQKQFGGALLFVCASVAFAGLAVVA